MNNTLQQVVRLLWRGLWLEPEAYDEAADGDNTFVEGLFTVVLVGLVLGIAALIGGVLDWAIMPDLSAIKDLVFNGLKQMPWYEYIRQEPEALRLFEQNYDLGWQISSFFQPNPANLLTGLILTPLGLIVGWLWFAVVGQGVAKLLGSTGEMKQTMGATALAVAPNLLNIFGLLPMVGVAAVGTWTLIARYVAMRRVHENLTWGRVLVAVLAPTAVLVLLGLVLALIFSSLLAALIGGLAS